MKKSKPPKTDSIEELVRFWDTNDLTDFEDELVEIKEPVFKRDESIRVQLDARQAKAVRQIARSKGVSQGELVRKWVLEKLNAPRRRIQS